MGGGDSFRETLARAKHGKQRRQTAKTVRSLVCLLVLCTPVLYCCERLCVFFVYQYTCVCCCVRLFVFAFVLYILVRYHGPRGLAGQSAKRRIPKRFLDRACMFYGLVVFNRVCGVSCLQRGNIEMCVRCAYICMCHRSGLKHGSLGYCMMCLSIFLLRRQSVRHLSFLLLFIETLIPFFHALSCLSLSLLPVSFFMFSCPSPRTCHPLVVHRALGGETGASARLSREGGGEARGVHGPDGHQGGPEDHDTAPP